MDSIQPSLITGTPEPSLRAKVCYKVVVLAQPG